VKAKDKVTNEEKEITGKYSVILYQKQGLSFVLTLEKELFGEQLNVEVL
jgi:hypothetical protein